MEMRDQDSWESDARSGWRLGVDFRKAQMEIQKVLEAISGMENEGIDPFMGLDPGDDWEQWYSVLEHALVALQNMERAR
jgi:trans-2-enoyl-CoA reductase